MCVARPLKNPKWQEARNEKLHTPLNIDQALDARDAIAKALYRYKKKQVSSGKSVGSNLDMIDCCLQTVISGDFVYYIVRCSDGW